MPGRRNGECKHPEAGCCSNEKDIHGVDHTEKK